MAKKAKTNEAEEPVKEKGGSPKQRRAAMSRFLKTINSDSVSLAHNSLSLNIEYIDTGNYAFNGILSGSLYGGIPVGLMTGFSGPSMSGKSLIAARIVGNAQKKGYFPIIFETEGAWNHGMEKLGVKLDECHIMHVQTIEDTKTQMIKLLNKIKEDRAEGIDDKYIIVLDSLGALCTQKELTDSQEGSFAVDMGTRARIIKAWARQVTLKLKVMNIPFVFTNHTYENPAQMTPQLVKNTGGGTGVKYMSTVLVQFGMNLDNIKDDPKATDFTALTHLVKGVKIPAITTKNRGVPPFLKTVLNINFTTGLDKYSGLFEMGQACGVILGDRTFSLPDGTNLGYRKNFEDNPEIWETKIMPLIEAELKRTIKYSDILVGGVLDLNPDLDDEEGDIEEEK